MPLKKHKPDYVPDSLWEQHLRFVSDGPSSRVEISNRLLFGSESDRLIALLGFGLPEEEEKLKTWHSVAISSAQHDFCDLADKAKRHRSLMEDIADKARQLATLLEDAEKMWDDEGVDTPPSILSSSFPALEDYFNINPDWIPYCDGEITDKQREYLALDCAMPRPAEIVWKVYEEATLASRKDGSVFINPIMEQLASYPARTELARYINAFDAYAKALGISVSHEVMRIQASLVLDRGGISKEAVIKARQRRRRGGRNSNESIA